MQFFLDARNRNAPAEEISFGISAIIVGLQAGVIASSGGSPDGGWVQFDGEPEKSLDAASASGAHDAAAAITQLRAEFDELMSRSVDDQRLSHVAIMLGACKINWWKENHHVGQGAPSGYFKKVAPAMREKIAPDMADEAFRTCCHTYSKWYSTLAVLSAFGIEDTKEFEPVVPTKEGCSFKVATDAGLRIDSNPSGTARLFLAHAGATLAFKSVFGALMPNASDFVTVAAAVGEVRRARVRYHTGAAYLCGAKNRGTDARPYDDMEYAGYLGRIGTYLSVMVPKSTLMASPHLANGKYQNYPDFDPSYEKLLREMKTKMKVDIRDLKMSSGYAGAAASYDTIMLAFDMKANDAVRTTLANAAVSEAERMRQGAGQHDDAADDDNCHRYAG